VRGPVHRAADPACATRAAGQRLEAAG